MSQARNITPIDGPAIPDKLYFRIGEVARLLHVETHTLRFWESEFPQLKVGKGGTGQRLYRRKDVELLLDIKHLLYDLGYTIPGARQRIASRFHRTGPELIQPGGNKPEDRLERIRMELRELSALLGKDARTRTGKMGRQVSPNHTERAENHTHPSRKGGPRTLHLASPSGYRVAPSPLHHGPGLFDENRKNP